MFSPIKKELPTHLPPPPSGINLEKFKKNSVSLPQMRTMNDIIEKEMERNEQQRRIVPISSPMSPQKLVRPPASNASRMSQVIEDSIRGSPAPRPSELEGMFDFLFFSQSRSIFILFPVHLRLFFILFRHF